MDFPPCQGDLIRLTLDPVDFDCDSLDVLVLEVSETKMEHKQNDWVTCLVLPTTGGRPWEHDMDREYVECDVMLLSR